MNTVAETPLKRLGSLEKNPKLARWVEEVTQLCKPDRVHWCDGSREEYQSMLRLMTPCHCWHAFTT